MSFSNEHSVSYELLINDDSFLIIEQSVYCSKYQYPKQTALSAIQQIL